MTKLADELSEYFKSTGAKTFERDDCFNVDGITTTNVDGLLDELVAHDKITIDIDFIPPRITLID